VIDDTPPDGFADDDAIASPLVTARTLPPVAVDVITCVPVVAAVVPPCTLSVDVIVCVWLMTAVNGVPVNVWAGTVPLDPVNVGPPPGPACAPLAVVRAVPFAPAAVPECVCAVSFAAVGTDAGPATPGVPPVPAGVPPDVALEVTESPVNVGCETDPA